MDEKMYNLYEDEIEINLVNLIFYLLKKWRSLLVVIVLGIAIGGAVYMVKKPADIEEIAVVPAEDYEAEPDVKANMELAYQYRELYKDQLEYKQNSVLMQLNPNEVYTGVLKYYVSAGNNTRLICELLQNIVNESDLLDEIKKEIQLDCQDQYVKELINCWVDWENDPHVSINNMAGDLTENLGTDHNNAMFYCLFTFKDQDNCEKAIRIIQKRIEQIEQNCQEIYGNYSFLNVNDSVRMEVNSDVLGKQKNNADIINTYLNNITKLESTFEKEDLSYYEAFYLNKEKEQQETVSEGNSGNLVKWLCIGIILACICWAGYHIIRYVLDKHIKQVEELKRRYRLPVLGYLDSTHGENRGLDGYIDKLYRKHDMLKDAEDYLQKSIKVLDKERLLLCGDMTNPDIAGLAQKLCSEDSRLKSAGFIHQDGDALMLLKNVDSIILLAQIGRTMNCEIKRELEVCRMKEITIEGVIVLG